MEWYFDGIGTEIIGIVISLMIGSLGGGAVGYKIGVKQKQTAGNNAEQRQELYVCKSDVGNNSSKGKRNIRQSQKAGNNAVQKQIGGINNDCR